MRLLTAPEKVSPAFIETVLARIPLPEARLLSPLPHSKKRAKARKGEPVSERIKSAVSVAEFISHYIELDARGKGFCPFHDDQKKSFQVSTDGNFWNCYAGCGGGSIIDFWMRWREIHHQNGDFTSTLSDLAKLLL